MSTFDFNGNQVYYEVYGQGKPLVILNGIMMSTKSWVKFIPSFSKDNMLILVDLLDQGQSQKMSHNYDQSVQADLVLALADHLKLEKLNIMGISYGGEVSLKYAIKYGDRLDRLMLFNTTAATEEWLREIGRGWNKVGLTRDGEAYYSVTIPVIYSPEFYIKNIDWMTNRKKTLVPLFSNPQFLDAMQRLVISSDYHDVRSDLDKITAPTLIVGCDKDCLVPLQEQEYLNKHIKNSTLVVIRDSGHASMYEKPLVFSSLVLGFVNCLDDKFEI